MPPLSRRNVFGVPTPAAAASFAAPVATALPLAAARKTEISRRGMLRVFAAGAGLCVAAPAVASLPVFDKGIPDFDPKAIRYGKTVALVFDSEEGRVELGRRMLLSGDIDQMVLLSFYPEKQAAAHFDSGNAKLQAVPIFNDPKNTGEEAIAAIEWLKSNSYRNVVIIGARPHIQRCCELLSPVADRYTISKCAVEAEINTPLYCAERYKLGLTRLGLITRIPGYQIPWI